MTGCKTHFIKKHAQHATRVMRFETPHGTFTTPTFMPVGTRAFLNYLTPTDLTETKTQIILGGNTYHMLVSPGLETIEALGGMHRMMNWQGPMLTDSGGYQVFSLSKNSQICKINEEGAHFKHPTTGQVIHLTPTSSLHTQKVIGADIIMAFDQCTPDTTDKEKVYQAMQRTHRWLLASQAYQQKNPCSVYGKTQALFGIIQGGCFRDLREESAQFVTSLNLDGIAIGGETIGYDMEKTVEILQWLQAYLPVEKLRYTMGVGLSPQDLIEVTRWGVDIFDCVAPTRNARHGALYHGRVIKENNLLKFESDFENSRLQIKKSQYAKDENPILENCLCHTCQHYSRGYLHYLFKTNLLAFSHLACIHNIHLMQFVCEKIQEDVML